MWNDPAVALGANWLVMITLLMTLTYTQKITSILIFFSCPQSACFAQGAIISVVLLWVQNLKKKKRNQDRVEDKPTLQTIDCGILEEKPEL